MGSVLLSKAKENLIKHNSSKNRYFSNMQYHVDMFDASANAARWVQLSNSFLLFHIHSQLNVY